MVVLVACKNKEDHLINDVLEWSQHYPSIFKMPGACLRAKSKYAGGGYGRGRPPPIR